MRLLGIYLNDHLAAAQAERDLIHRCVRQNRGSALASVLDRHLAEVDDDIVAISRLLAARGLRQSRIKPVLARLAERAGRLKLNGQLTGYSPLSRLVELEAMLAAAVHRHSLWHSLASIGPDEERAAWRAERAGRQRVDLETQAVEARRLALDQSGEGAAGSVR